MKRLRVLVLVHPDLIPPESSKGYTEQEINEWKTEYDVVTTLRAAGHEVRPLGVHDELKPIRDEIEGWKPDVVFTLLEQFHGEAIYDQNVASYLELMHVPYTGCNPRGLMLARGKDLSKTLVHYHRIPVPAFAVFPDAPQGEAAGAAGAAADRQERQRGRLLRHFAGLGRRHRREARRARQLHPRAHRHRRHRRAIYRGARDLCRRRRQRTAARAAGVGAEIPATWRRATGSSPPRRSSTIPTIRNAAASCTGRPRTSRRNCARIQRMAKRIYRTLELDGYARIDFRLAADGTPYFLEANPNPEIAESQEFATAAKHDRHQLSRPAASYRGARHQARRPRPRPRIEAAAGCPA